MTSLYPESVRGRNNLGTELLWQSKSRGCVACAAEAERLFESLIQRDATDTYAILILLSSDGLPHQPS